MARPYSPDLRERVVSAVEDGMTCRDAAVHFLVSHALVIRCRVKKEVRRHRRWAANASFR